MKTAKTLTSMGTTGAYDYPVGAAVVKTRRHYYLQTWGFRWRGNEGGAEEVHNLIDRRTAQTAKRIIREQNVSLLETFSDALDDLALLVA